MQILQEKISVSEIPEESVIHAGLLRPRKTRQSGCLVVSVPLPHTAVISQPRALEVHINFNGLDHVLGALSGCVKSGAEVTWHRRMSDLTTLDCAYF